MPNAIALNSIQFNVAVMVGPALAGQALAKLGEKWCFGLNAHIVSRPHRVADDHPNPLPAGKDRGVDVRQLEAGHSIRPPTEFHGGADCAGFLHDCIELCPCAPTFRFSSKTSSIAARKLTAICSRSWEWVRFAARSSIASAGNIKKKGSCRSGRARLPGRGDAGFRSFEVAAA